MSFVIQLTKVLNNEMGYDDDDDDDAHKDGEQKLSRLERHGKARTGIGRPYYLQSIVNSPYSTSMASG